MSVDNSRGVDDDFDIDDGDVHPERSTEIVRARFDAYSFDRRFSSSVGVVGSVVNRATLARYSSGADDDVVAVVAAPPLLVVLPTTSRPGRVERGKDARASHGRWIRHFGRGRGRINLEEGGIR